MKKIISLMTCFLIFCPLYSMSETKSDLAGNWKLKGYRCADNIDLRKEVNMLISLFFSTPGTLSFTDDTMKKAIKIQMDQTTECSASINSKHSLTETNTIQINTQAEVESSCKHSQVLLEKTTFIDNIINHSLSNLIEESDEVDQAKMEENLAQKEKLARSHINNMIGVFGGIENFFNEVIVAGNILPINLELKFEVKDNILTFIHNTDNSGRICPKDVLIIEEYTRL